MQISKISKGSEILGEWIASIRKNPLRDGVTRMVTVAKDDATRIIGRDNGFVFLETIKPDGFQKVVSKVTNTNTSLRFFKYPDGSWSLTHYTGAKPIRTEGEFVITHKTGIIQKLGYSQDGYSAPKTRKETVLRILDALGKPDKEVDLRLMFETAPNSKLVKLLGDVKYKVGKFCERLKSGNRQLRKWANNINRNA